MQFISGVRHLPCSKFQAKVRPTCCNLRSRGEGGGNVIEKREGERANCEGERVNCEGRGALFSPTPPNTPRKAITQGGLWMRISGNLPTTCLGFGPSRV